MREGFMFLNEHTSDRGLKLLSRDFPTPSEKEILESVPFMQGSYDFSDILGERVFENRSLTYVFKMQARSYEEAKTKTTSIRNWLMKSSINPLYDDYNPNYYYKAKCVSVDFDVSPIGFADVTIEFNAYPFKINEKPEGNDIWDIFNFELDVFQNTSFTVSGERAVTLINPGSVGVIPVIKANASFIIEKGNRTFSVVAGETKSSLFRLDIGENELTIVGNGDIEFLFYKELL